MKGEKLITLLLLGLVIPSFNAHAQYLPQVEGNLQEPAAPIVSPGQGLIDTGRALVFTGVGLAATGLFLFIGDSISFEKEDHEMPTSPVYAYVALLCGAAGGGLMLLGLPFLIAGHDKMDSNGGMEIRFGGDTQGGASILAEVGLRIPDFASVDVLGGRNFGPHVFLGGGLGYRGFLFSGDDEEKGLLPVYANARFTAGYHRTSPYAGLGLGWEMSFSAPYIAFDFGARIRTIKGRRGKGWWIGSRLEYVPKEAEMLSLKLGRSF